MPNTPKDTGNLHENSGEKSAREFIYGEELGQDDLLVYEVSFRHVTRTMSEEYRTSHRLHDKLLVTQSWRSFPSRQQTALCVTGSQWERLFIKAVSLLHSLQSNQMKRTPQDHINELII